MTLKILNDLWKETETQNVEYHPIDIQILRKHDFQRVQQEAIKWIKEIKKIDNKEEKDYQLANRIGLDGADLYCCPYILIRWIKHFFNITEGGLE